MGCVIHYPYVSWFGLTVKHQAGSVELYQIFMDIVLSLDWLSCLGLQVQMLLLWTLVCLPENYQNKDLRPVPADLCVQKPCRKLRFK